MRWEQLDLVSGTWTTRKGIKVMLIPSAVEILTRRRIAVEQNNPWVFPTDSKASKKCGHMNFPNRPFLRLLLHFGVTNETARQISGTKGIPKF
jgi:hypothetical protein